MSIRPLPPPLPDDDHDERQPDELTTWQRLQRRGAAALAYTPATRPKPAPLGTIPQDTNERLALLKRVPLAQVRPRTKPVTVDGYTRTEPSASFWCVAANLHPDEGAGARLVESETGDLLARGYVQYGVAVGLATWNEAIRRSGSVFTLVTKDARSVHAGYFGKQSGRWASSIQDPTTRALEAFRLATDLHGDALDFTAGARRWDDGYTQDRLWAAARVKHDAMGIVRKWAAEGWQWVGPIYEPDGKTVLIDPYRLMLFSFVGRRADVWRGEQAIKDGRSRWGVK